MIRKLLITLTVVIGTIGVGWGAETTKLTTADNICFANGNPITITESTTAGSVTITVTGTQETVTIASTGTVYGGSKNTEAASSTITMESGTIANIYGGGLGEVSGTPANIKGNTSITIKGGTVSNLLVGGGHFYSKSNDVTINISGSTTKLASVISGGYDAGKTTNSLTTTLANSVNGVNSVTLNMTEGEITEGLGCGGGNGFSYTGKSVITLNGVKLAAFYGVLSNGRADDIKATVTNCTFAKNGDWYEFASVNRGTAANIDFTFDGCTFNNLDQINASLGPVNGWADSDTDGKVIPCVTGKTKFVFTNTKGEAPVMQVGQGLETADIELTGAKAKIDKFVKKNPSETITAFTIGAGKTWTFNNGLEIAKEVTLTQTGTLVVKGEYSVANAEQLVAAVAVAPADATIRLAADTFELATALTIDKPITIEGVSTTKLPVIKTKEDKNAFLISTTDGVVTFKNIHIQGDKEATLVAEKRNSIGIAFPTPNKFAGRLTLENVTIENYFFGINCGAVATATSAPKNTLSISNSRFVECLHKAVYTENSEVLIKNSTFTNCATTTKPTSGWFTTVAVDINLKYGTYSKAEITGCTFVQNGVTAVEPPTAAFPDAIAYSTALAVKARNDGDTYSKNPASLANAVITGNTFTKNSVGIQLGEPQTKAANVLTAVTMSNNTFTGNHNNIINSSTNTTFASEVCNEKGLKDAITNAAAGATIQLAAGTYALDKQLIVNKPITVNGAGAGTIITAAEGANLWDGLGSTKNLISIQGEATGTVALKDLTIQGSKASGINVQSAMATTLNNVTLKGNANAGMIVHSKVDATGLHTEGNTWGGVNVDNGTPAYSTLAFGFDATSTFAEVKKVWSEITAEDPVIVTTPTGKGWYSYLGKGGKDNKTDMRFWDNTSLTTEVADAAALTAAITTARPGQIIILTAATYGTETAPALMGEVKVDNVTIKAKDGLTAKPKVYGTIKVLAEGCTIDGLEMYTKSNGTAALKNIIDVVAMSVTITNNVFHMQTPTAGNVSNGVCIWPYGTSDNPAYVVKGNTFNDFNAVVPDWSSTAMLVTEGVELSRFTGFTTSDKSKVVTLVNEKDFLTGNTFTNCDLDYTHANWAAGTNTNVKGEAPYYSFTGNSNVSAFKDAVAYSVTKAYIEASFITEKQALDVLNTKDAIAHVNAIPDSIVINCKDAYLVTGEKAAKAFAATERDKAVFWLKRATAADYTFSTVAVGNNWRIIGKNTTWNDAANVNRSVEIKAGAKLTINVAMALDSVRMDEGAELITALPVTAKTLQAKYTVAANKWKPFAFPVSGMTVKDAKDANTVALVASTADGVWFAGLSTSNAPAFEHKDAFAQAGIIAANVETEILVASPATSIILTTKSEPTAPTTGFKLEANPNLFAMTLTQTAYVLNEAGTAFERRDGAVIKPFQSYVLADAKTTATLRSLRVDGVVTENEIIPTEGYYVESAQGAIVIHTAESVVVEVVDMTGRIVYKAQETMDGCRIALPAGIYAVNRQMVIVK